MCIYIYIINNKYTPYTHIVCKHKHIFECDLITFNHFTALLRTFIFFIKSKQESRQIWKKCIITDINLAVFETTCSDTQYVAQIVVGKSNSLYGYRTLNLLIYILFILLFKGNL